ncbi:hypothetical protein ACA910_001168 [Epithemia clementina (nom. ined.)]
MVLNVTLLEKDIGISLEEIDEMRRTRKFYSFLHAKREEFDGKKLKEEERRVKKAETMHYRTVAFKDALLRGTASPSVLVSFLNEINGVPCSQKAFGTTNVKERFLQEREQRIRAHFTRDHDARKRTNKLLLEYNLNPADNVAVFYREESTHYDVLGVGCDASTKEIRSKFLALSKIFHPDKRPIADSAFIFRRLSEARDVLCCSNSRIKYDRDMERKAKAPGNTDQK